MSRCVSHRLQWSEEVQAYELYDENASRQLTLMAADIYPLGGHRATIKAL